jgi:hypothetical protein
MGYSVGDCTTAGGDMDMLLDPFTMRMFERLLIVAGGILSIYFGYRLFSITANHAATGTLKSQLAEISISKVGPGVFFALFGAYIINGASTNPTPYYRAEHRVESSADEAASEKLLASLASIIKTVPKDADRIAAEQILSSMQTKTPPSQDLLLCFNGLGVCPPALSFK